MGRSVDCPIRLDWMVMTNESIIQALEIVSWPKIARIISHSAISFQIFIQVIYKSLSFNGGLFFSTASQK